jgi:hypothetical protein
MKKAELLRLKNLCVLNSEFCKKPPMMIPLPMWRILFQSCKSKSFALQGCLLQQHHEKISFGGKCVKNVTTTVTTCVVTRKAYIEAILTDCCHHPMVTRKAYIQAILCNIVTNIYIPPTFYLFRYPLYKSGDSGIFLFSFNGLSVTIGVVTQVVTLCFMVSE